MKKTTITLVVLSIFTIIVGIPIISAYLEDKADNTTEEYQDGILSESAVESETKNWEKIDIPDVGYIKIPPTLKRKSFLEKIINNTMVSLYAKAIGWKKDYHPANIIFIPTDESLSIQLEILKVPYKKPEKVDFSKSYNKDTYDRLLQTQVEALEASQRMLDNTEIKEIADMGVTRIRSLYAIYINYSVLIYSQQIKNIIYYTICTDTAAYNLIITYENKLTKAWKKDLLNSIHTFTITGNNDAG